jgi:hypothetical protein
MMTRGVSFLAALANRVGLTTSTQGTPLLLTRHHPQLLVITPVPGRLDGAKARVNVLVGEGQPKIRAAALRELCSLVSPPTRTDSSGNIVDAEPLP